MCIFAKTAKSGNLVPRTFQHPLELEFIVYLNGGWVDNTPEVLEKYTDERIKFEDHAES